jgi:hypothetical protein
MSAAHTAQPIAVDEQQPPVGQPVDTARERGRAADNLADARRAEGFAVFLESPGPGWLPWMRGLGMSELGLLGAGLV